MTDDPDASIDAVIVTYQGAGTVAACVRSAAASIGVRVHPLVVDNASSDRSVSVAREAGADVVSLESNVGYGAACNVGLERSGSPWIAFVNQDVEFGPDVLRTLLDAARAWEERTGRPVVVGPKLVDGDGRTAETFHRLPTLGRQMVGLLTSERWAGVRDRSTSDEQQLCGWVSAAFILGRTDTFRSVGGFDARYFMYVEDVDLFARLADVGSLCVWVPDARVVHNGGRRPLPPALHAQAIRNWSLYFRTRQGRVAGHLTHTLGVMGSLGRSVVWLTKGATGDPVARRYARMFGFGAWQAIRPPADPAGR